MIIYPTLTLLQTGFALVDSGIMAAATFYMTVSQALSLLPDNSPLTQLQKLLAVHSPPAMYLLLPYCAWLSFATYLNGGIWWLNGSAETSVKQE